MIEPAQKRLEVHFEAVSEAEQLLDDWEWSADALERLAQLRVTQRAVEYLIRDTVVECRTNAVVTGFDTVDDETRQTATSRPVSWRKIGEALGMSGQSAHQRFAHEIEN